ncbi:MAG: hypothetical protein JNJ54_07605 [Myxococcaceae bacterium]|nr:hypothetical protein [Myxococcaceae bacterium]
MGLDDSFPARVLFAADPPKKDAGKDAKAAVAPSDPAVSDAPARRSRGRVGSTA